MRMRKDREAILELASISDADAAHARSVLVIRNVSRRKAVLLKHQLSKIESSHPVHRVHPVYSSCRARNAADAAGVHHQVSHLARLSSFLVASGGNSMLLFL